MLKLKHITFSLIVSSLLVSTCYGMDGEQRRAQVRARLQKKQEQKTQQETETEQRRQIVTIDPEEALKKTSEILSLANTMTPQEKARFVSSMTPEQLRQLQEAQRALEKSQIENANGIYKILTTSNPELLKAIESEIGPNLIANYQERGQKLLCTAPSEQTQYSEKIRKIDLCFQDIHDMEVQVLQSQKIFDLFVEQGLDWSLVSTIKDNLFARLRSVLKYITDVRNGVEKEAKFYSGINPNFSPKEAVILGLLPFKHEFRRQFIVTLEPVVINKPLLEYTPADDLEKAILRGGYGLGAATLLTCIEGKPWDFKTLLNAYINISRYALLDLQHHIEFLDDLEKKLPVSISKKCAFFYASFCENAVESLLQFSEILFPYVNAINSVLKIPGYEEVFSCQNMINEGLEQVKAQGQKEKKPPFSRAKVLALQERYRQKEEAERTPQLEVIKKKPLSARDEATEKDYPSVPTPQNLKKEYRETAEQDLRAKRKQELRAKRNKDKKKDVPSLERPVKYLTQQNEASEKENKPIIKIGGGPFKIYEKIRNKTFKGSPEKFVVLIEALGGTVDEGRSGSRIKFELPHIMNNKATAYLDMLPPEYEGEEGEPAAEVQNTPASNDPVIHDGMHAPHKKKSNKCRPEHNEDFNNLLTKAGYDEGAVQKK